MRCSKSRTVLYPSGIQGSPLFLSVCSKSSSSILSSSSETAQAYIRRWSCVIVELELVAFFVMGQQIAIIGENFLRFP